MKLNVLSPGEILAQRANLLAVPIKETTHAADLLQLVTFSLGGARYGIADAQVRGVSRLGRVTRVPGAPRAIAGITMHLGDLLTVVDLRVLLNLAGSASGEFHGLLVLADGHGYLGLTVEEFGELTAAPVRAVHDAAPSAAGMGAELIQGVTPDGIIVINTAGLLAHPDVKAA